MRAVVMTAALGLALAACSKQDTATGGTTAPSATPTPMASASSFSPPTSISRADYGGRLERRFRKLDKNQDDKLSADELPNGRGERLLRRLDTNGDGSISQDEWSKGMLARFDKRDANHDGNLTSDERGKHGGKRGGGRKRDRMDRAADSDTISDNGDEVDSDL